MLQNKLIVKYVNVFKDKSKILDITCADMPKIVITRYSLFH